MRDRIKQIMENEHMTPSAFADRLHIGRAVMSHLLNGRNNPSLDVVTRILAEMEYIDSNWLLMGEGEMYKKDAKQSSASNQPDSSSSTPTNSSNSTTLRPNDDLFSQATEPVIENSEIKNDSSPEREPVVQNQLPKSVENTINTGNPTANNEYHKENIVERAENSDKIEDIQADKVIKMSSSKKVNKIIIYYNDNTFEIFEANNQTL